MSRSPSSDKSAASSGCMGVKGRPIAIEGDIEAGGEEAGFKSGGAEHGLLREGHSLEGEQLLGVNGLIGGGEVGLEIGDLLEVFEADYGEGGGREPVCDAIPCGAGLAFRRARAGALGRVGAIGRELFFGDRHEVSFRSTNSIRGKGWCAFLVEERWKERSYFVGECVIRGLRPRTS